MPCFGRLGDCAAVLVGRDKLRPPFGQLFTSSIPDDSGIINLVMLWQLGFMTDPRIQQYESWLSSRGSQLSDARRQIATIVFAKPSLLELDATVDAVTQAMAPEQVSRSTICRTLFHLQEAGLIRVNHDFTGPS